LGNHKGIIFRCRSIQGCRQKKYTLVQDAYLYFTVSINPKNTKNKLSQWLLPVILLLSLISFSSGTSISSAEDRQTVKNELRISNCFQHKRTISFTRAIQLSNVDFCLASSKIFGETVLLHDLLFKVRLQHLDKLLFFIKRIGNEIHHKAIPQSSDEDLFIL
jgi:hypothetical protein